MANQTVKDAKSVHGTNPQFLVEKIIRTRIYESRYWKEDCFALTADLVVDKGVDLRYIGGIYGGNIKPTPFLCLTLKLLQLQPDKEIIIEFIQQENFKYIRALGAFYFRLVANSVEIFKYLEPLYADSRKLRRCNRMGTFDAIYMDEFIDMLLREERVFDVILPRLTKRFVHEENSELLPRQSEVSLSELEEDAEPEDEKEEEEKKQDVKPKEREDKKVDRRRHDDRERDERRRRKSRSVSPYSRSRRSRSRDRDRRSRRSRSSSRDRRDRDRKRRDDRGDKKKRDEEPKKDKAKTETDEIAEMNALRARLGLKPLKM